MSDEGRRDFQSKTMRVSEAELESYLEPLSAEDGQEALVVEPVSIPPPLPRRRGGRMWFLGAVVILLGVVLGLGAGWWLGLFRSKTTAVAPSAPRPTAVTPIALEEVQVDLTDPSETNSDRLE